MAVLLPRSTFLALFCLACGHSPVETKSPPPPPAEPAATQPAPPPAPAGAPAFAEPPAEELQRESRREGLARDDAGEADALRVAEADLERAKAELDAALGSTPGAAATSAPRATRAPSTGAADAEAPKAKPEKKAAANPCHTACRAFASLTRASNSVCRLAGDADARCSRARAMVTEAERRVASCSCRPE